VTAVRPWTTQGLDLFEDYRWITAWRGTEHVGQAFAVVVDEPDKHWFGKLRGQDAVRFETRHAALAHVVGGCPDCTCDPILCAEDDSGDSCIDCGACLHGCPEGLCDMTEENQ
jgi:hypothetical protein